MFAVAIRDIIIEGDLCMRLFIAINFNEKIKDRLCEMQGQLKAQTYAGNFSRRENLHLTLVFLGVNITHTRKTASNPLDRKLTFC